MRATRIITTIFTCMVLVSSVFLTPLVAAENSESPPPGQTVKDSLKSPDDAPAMAFEATDFKFASALDGDLITHQYTFKNTGTQDLEIKQVKVG